MFGGVSVDMIIFQQISIIVQIAVNQCNQFDDNNTKTTVILLLIIINNYSNLTVIATLFENINFGSNAEP